MTADHPAQWGYGVGGGGHMVPAHAARGAYMAREAAAAGHAAFQGFVHPLESRPHQPHAGAPTRQRQKITEKITGNAPVLPAKRRAEFQAQLAQRQIEEEMLRRQMHPEEFADEQEVPKRSAEEQIEYDATVAAIRHELASTDIHMATLEARRTKLVARLAAMGEEA